MSKNKTPEKPAAEQLALLKDRYEVSGTGIVVKNKYTHSPEVGEPAGTPQTAGYLKVGVLYRNLLVHHIVWFLTHNQWPEHRLDHIDGNILNNSPDNLRQVTNSQNLRGHSKIRGAVKYRGVYHKNRRYSATYTHDSKKIHIGYYDTAEEAAIARDIKCYKEFDYPWEGLNKIGQDYILKHHPDWIKGD